MDHFSSDDSSRDSSSSSSSESSSDALSDFASSRSSSDHSLPTPSSGMRPNHHLCSLVLSIHRSSAAIFDRPSHNSSFASPSHKRSRSPAASIDIDHEIQAKIDECIAYADALRDKGIDARVVVEAIDREEIKTGVRSLIEVRVDRVTHPVVADDIPEPAYEGAVEAIESVLRDQGYRIVATGQQSADMLERIVELERDNTRLRDMIDVASQRVARSQRRELHVQIEMRQIRHFRFYDRMRIARLEACARRNLGYHGSGQEEVNGNGGNGNERNGNEGNGNRENGNGRNGNGGNRNGNGNEG
ncbi:hypothetical protein Tco_1432896 [Tanacetum coccineum]